jgi:hypothetical protein
LRTAEREVPFQVVSGQTLSDQEKPHDHYRENRRDLQQEMIYPEYPALYPYILLIFALDCLWNKINRIYMIFRIKPGCDGAQKYSTFKT